MSRRLFALVGAALTGGAGCADHTVVPQDAPVGEPSRTSPEGTFEMFRSALQNEQLDLYESTLHRDFFFVPADPDQAPLDYDAALAATQRLFERYDDILVAAHRTGSVPSAEPDFPAAEGFRTIHVNPFRIFADTREVITGEPLILEIGTRPVTFVFAPDATTHPVEYRIIRQVEHE